VLCEYGGKPGVEPHVVRMLGDTLRVDRPSFVPPLRIVEQSSQIVAKEALRLALSLSGG